ncbi:23S rRNA (uracil(1939)-C(5))-methyltransferase RlmD [Lentilactobacillus laojiaonis]|uniref:23S rRNA (uracil(1939)-C(5))-methyltransferase RlmD n=1 Tax=Lentilactobacillus laojiaonis TaxID=2883998 RepID=UPI001D09FE1F|nr:23S rRNA (uracil(1939)-C(5))-methyltransferase RlmD [Lentilactobacillus laojiaonis]UDM32417.1 23S rRNA (uracil(1939)-C(5))-methyltransferase RlmD [Lentilactobacillus laojiaonis]
MKKTIPVIKNEEYTVKINDLTYEGMGVAKIDNFPIFIENTLPDEEAVIKVIKVKSTYAFGKVMQYLVKSPNRVEEVDRVYTQTGIAPLQHLAYDAQLAFKKHQVEIDFQKLGIETEVLDTIGMDDPTHYRNKAQVPVRMVNGKLETGFYRKHSHDVVPIEDFYIQDEEIDKAILAVRDVLRKFQVTPYDERVHKGTIRNVMVRRGRNSHEMMIVLITRTNKLPNKEFIVNDILKQLPNVDSIIQNVNSEKTNALMGHKNIVLHGKPTIKDTLLGLEFEISATSFYQVNPEQTEKLYSLAVQKADLKPDDVVIDAYCGIGTISLTLAQHVKQVYGVEVVEEAIENAKLNAQLNHIENVEFVANKAEDQMAKWQADGLKPDVIVVDPPRKGLDASLIESVSQMAPKRVVYVSCNPATLARDVQRFMELGYSIKDPIQPVDQFPQTVHIESVTVLEKD